MHRIMSYWAAALIVSGIVSACQPSTSTPASPPTAASPAPVTSSSVASPVASPAAGGPFAAASPVVSPAASPASVSAAAPSPVACQMVLGFATFRDIVGASQVGTCLEPERQVPSNGNTEQPTTNGLLVLRALDGRVMFVASDRTWVNHDGVVETRPTDRRFEWEGDRQLVDALRGGGHVVYFRHGATDPNERDTDANNLANCATQRNLTDAGRQQGQSIGEALRAMNVPVGQVRSSGYCRAGEYARLLFNIDPEVESSMALPDPLTEQQRTQNTETFKLILARPPQAGTNTFLVAHSPNIRLAADVDLPEEGGAAVLRMEHGAPMLVGRVRPDEWSVWARALALR
jgi:phosphohistidine phosphatase SixA